MTNKNDNYDYVKLFSYLDDLNSSANPELVNKCMQSGVPTTR